MPNWIKEFAPDVAATLVRFPFAILLSLVSTLIAIALTNGILPSGNDVWIRLAVGLSFGAVFAVAGVLYGESRRQNGTIFFLIAYFLPLIVAALMQVESTDWIVAPMLGPIGLLWLSVSAFTHTGTADQRIEIENKFWWLNHRAITTAIIAGIGFGLISLGLIAVERAMAVLFGLKAGKLFYEILLPFTGLFLTPVYWLSTIPKLEEFKQSEISEPDFLSRAIGFLGQFVLTPFLLIYALILLAYALQIVFTQSLPQGMLSWMVLGFTIVGAANWLVLHPEFMHARPLVKYFRKFWFWLTLIPIALYVLGVFVRIEAYGLTAQRVGLIAGGLWFALLSVAFLTKKFADIRLVPGLALLVISLFSIGPLNFVNIAQINQAARLDSAIHGATPITQSLGGPYEWTEQSAQTARGAVQYLLRNDKDTKLGTVLRRHGVNIEDGQTRRTPIIAALNLEQFTEQTQQSIYRSLEPATGNAANVSSTPNYYGRVRVFNRAQADIVNLTFKIEENKLMVAGTDQLLQMIDLDAWLSQQSESTITNTILDFENQGQNFRMIIEGVELRRISDDADEWKLTSLEFVLFSDAGPANNLPSTNLTSQ